MRSKKNNEFHSSARLSFNGAVDRTLCSQGLGLQAFVRILRLGMSGAGKLEYQPRSEEA